MGGFQFKSDNALLLTSIEVDEVMQIGESCLKRGIEIPPTNMLHCSGILFRRHRAKSGPGSIDSVLGL